MVGGGVGYGSGHENRDYKGWFGWVLGREGKVGGEMTSVIPYLVLVMIHSHNALDPILLPRERSC